MCLRFRVLRFADEFLLSNYYFSIWPKKSKHYIFRLNKTRLSGKFTIPQHVAAAVRPSGSPQTRLCIKTISLAYVGFLNRFSSPWAANFLIFFLANFKDNSLMDYL